MITKKQILKIALAGLFVFLMLYANFFIIRKMSEYGLKLYIYDKLLVAYDVGSIRGTKEELNKMVSATDRPMQYKEALKVKESVDAAKDVHVFLKDKVEENRIRLIHLRNFRTIAFILITVIFILRIVIVAREQRSKN